jgi:hypothetical protein
MPSGRKPYHDCITSTQCIFLHHVTLNTLHSAVTSNCSNLVSFIGFTSVLQEYIKPSFSWQGYKNSPFSEMSQLVLAPTHLPIQWASGGLPQGVKQPRHEVHNWPFPSAKVKSDWSYNPSPVMCLHGVHRTTYLYLFKVQSVKIPPLSYAHVASNSYSFRYIC